MIKHYTKNLICIILVLILLTSIIAVPSYAIADPITIGGLAVGVGALAWAISGAMGVDISVNGITPSGIADWFNPYYTVQSALQTTDFTFIKGIRAGFDALQLSLTAYSAIKEASANIIEDNNIPDNTTSSITTLGYFDGSPYYANGTSFLCHSMTISGQGTFYYGGTTITNYMEGSNKRCRVTLSSGYSSSSGYWGTSVYKSSTSSSGGIPTNFNVVVSLDNGGTFRYGPNTYTASLIQTGTNNFDFVSGTVDTSFGNNATQNVTIIIPANSSLTYQTPLIDIIDYINTLASADSSQVSVETDVAPVPPPTPVPVPTTPLGDVPFDEFVDYWGQSVTDGLQDVQGAIDTYGQSAVEAIENQTDVIDTVGQTVENIDDSLTSIDTNVATGKGILGRIETLVHSGINTISGLLTDIKTMVSELVQDIVLGTENLISGILNQIPNTFQSAWNSLKQHVSIWHYVVEWVTSITAPLTWIWGIASGTSYYIILPVYASLAGAVVLALYKKFGR